MVKPSSLRTVISHCVLMNASISVSTRRDLSRRRGRRDRTGRSGFRTCRASVVGVLRARLPRRVHAGRARRPARPGGPSTGRKNPPRPMCPDPPSGRTLLPAGSPPRRALPCATPWSCTIRSQHRPHRQGGTRRRYPTALRAKRGSLDHRSPDGTDHDHHRPPSAVRGGGAALPRERLVSGQTAIIRTGTGTGTGHRCACARGKPLPVTHVLSFRTRLNLLARRGDDEQPPPRPPVRTRPRAQRRQSARLGRWERLRPKRWCGRCRSSPKLIVPLQIDRATEVRR